MGNAIPELKEIAQYVTGTNCEDGVATAIEKYIG
ncbi:HAD hydrolase family protein [Yersinia pestis]|nr:HAD hydrolase family protein [Yersinia pestis]